MRCRIGPRMTPVGARCALRHDQKFVSRTPASAGLHYFHLPHRRADEFAGVVRQSTDAIDRQERGGHSSLRLELLRARPRAATSALRRDRSGARRGKASLAGASTPPAIFSPARAVSNAFLLRCRARGDWAFVAVVDSPPLSDRPRHPHWLLSSTPTRFISN
jgi:hypothetical protein